MTPRPPAGRPLARRALLAGGFAGLAGTVLVACTTASAGRPSARPGAAVAAPGGSAVGTSDTDAVQRARSTAAGLAAAADRLAAADQEHAGLLTAIAADHRTHVAALGAAVPGAPSPSPSVPPQAGRLADAVRAERDAAATALEDVLHASPPVAALLARIAGACAAHADLLAAAAGLPAPGPLAPPPAAAPAAPAVSPAGQGGNVEPAAPGALPPPRPVARPSAAAGPVAAPGTLELASAARDALMALTAGEHAAVFAYGLIVARVSPGRRGQARAAWAWHLARRDLLEERLLAAGVQPPAAAPAYDVGGTPNAAAASRLAATVERRLGALAVRAVAATEGNDRQEAAGGLVEVARRLAAWTGRPETLPG